MMEKLSDLRNTFYKHFLTLVLDTCCGHFMWTLLWGMFVGTFCGHFLGTLFVDTFLTLFLGPFRGHFLGKIKCSAEKTVNKKHNEKLN